LRIADTTGGFWLHPDTDHEDEILKRLVGKNYEIGETKFEAKYRTLWKFRDHWHAVFFREIKEKEKDGT